MDEPKRQDIAEQPPMRRMAIQQRPVDPVLLQHELQFLTQRILNLSCNPRLATVSTAYKEAIRVNSSKQSRKRPRKFQGRVT